MNKIVILGLLTTSFVLSAGYKIPEKSINSLALSGAYVAHTSGADTAYFNPASMVFMEDKNFVELGVIGVHLNEQAYSLNGIQDGASETENLPVPYVYYVSPKMGNFRAGLSLIVPAGLTKKWNTPFQKLSAEEFTLKIIEINPTLAYKINENISIGGGFRFIYSEGIVKSDGGDIFAIKRDMKGDAIAYGYNIAFLYKVSHDINFAFTYRSNIDIKEEGQANLTFGGITKQYDSDVTIPLPASLNIGISKTFLNKYTLEVLYERSFWSSYKNLDFNYNDTIYNPVLKSAFDDSKPKNWKDSNTFRVGLTANLTEKMTTMFGFSYDETPVPTKYLGFELADSNAINFSMGMRYKYTKNLSFGASFLYDIKDEIELESKEHYDTSALNPLYNGGTFDKGGAILATVGVAYKF